MTMPKNMVLLKKTWSAWRDRLTLRKRSSWRNRLKSWSNSKQWWKRRPPKRMSAVISMRSRPSFTLYRVDLGTKPRVKLKKRPKPLKNLGRRSVLQEVWCNPIPMSFLTTLLASNRPLLVLLQTKLVLQEPHQCQDQSQTCRVVRASGIDWCKSVRISSRQGHTQTMTL